MPLVLAGDILLVARIVSREMLIRWKMCISTGR